MESCRVITVSDRSASGEREDLCGPLLAEALSRAGFAVTSVVVPSTIDTPQNRSAIPDASFDTWVKPEAIAELIHFHCTDAAATLREPVIKVYNNA